MRLGPFRDSRLLCAVVGLMLPPRDGLTKVPGASVSSQADMSRKVEATAFPGGAVSRGGENLPVKRVLRQMLINIHINIYPP